MMKDQCPTLAAVGCLEQRNRGIGEWAHALLQRPFLLPSVPQSPAVACWPLGGSDPDRDTTAAHTRVVP